MYGERISLRSAVGPVQLRALDGGRPPQLGGRLMSWNQWAEVHERGERFLERFVPGSLRSFDPVASRVPLLLAHGRDGRAGQLPIGRVLQVTETDLAAEYLAALATGIDFITTEVLPRVAQDLLSVSVGFIPELVERTRFPRRSAFNPSGLEERTIRGARLIELSLTGSPAYTSASAAMVAH
jgi:phage head maturation protease